VPAEVTAGRGHEIFGTLIEGVRFALDSLLIVMGVSLAATLIYLRVLHTPAEQR
jgi:hypothetical protein